MKERNVITAFLEHHGKVLILKRSDKVRTYKRHWAGVSGSIEGDESPEARALIEIEEETSLSPSDVQLVRGGSPLRIGDGEYLWTVYPFLFLVEEPDKIRIDWEHSGKRWIYPDEINKFETVPNLEQTLERVYVEAEFAEAIDKIGKDRTHGASELVFMALDSLRDFVNQTESENMEELSDSIWKFCRHLHNVRPSMAPLTNSILHVLYSMELLDDREDIGTFKARFSRIVDKYVSDSKDAFYLVCENAKDLIKDNMTIFTHSYSSMVVNGILESNKRNLKIIATESRPLNEGEKTARKLAEKYGVTFITDAQAGYFMNKADVVMVGADSLLPDGSVVNKSGTYLIALAAQRQKVPVYVLCQTHKSHPVAYFGDEVELEEKDSREVMDDAIPNVRIRNIYFEITPPDLISGIVTERGLLKPVELGEIFGEMEKYRQIYGMI